VSPKTSDLCPRCSSPVAAPVKGLFLDKTADSMYSTLLFCSETCLDAYRVYSALEPRSQWENCRSCGFPFFCRMGSSLGCYCAGDLWG